MGIRNDRSKPRVALVIPTLNAARYWAALSEGIRRQRLQPDEILVVDSSSDDGTGDLAESAGYRVIRIERREFNHGKTRQMAVNMLPKADVLIFLTQDAVPASGDSFRRIVSHFEQDEIGAVYGRQLPASDASPISAHARLFSYPPVSEVRGREDIPQLGMRAARFSNSFGAYRRTALCRAGGFPADVIFGEDQYVTARMILDDWKVVYDADAQVFHSHDYSLMQEFRRSFDIGVFHSQAPWMLEAFGGASGEGLRYVRSEIGYLWSSSPILIPAALLRTAVKLLGYRLGREERRLPEMVKRHLSSMESFWNLPHPEAQAMRRAPSEQDVYVNE